MKRLLASLLVLAFFTGVLFPGIGAASDGLGNQNESVNEKTIQITHEYSLTPNNPGNITISVRYDIPKGVKDAPTEVLPSDAKVKKSEGFKKVSQDIKEYKWDGSTRNPELVFSYGINETYKNSKDNYIEVDTGDWAFITEYNTNYPYHKTNVTRTSDSPSAFTDLYIYLGEYNEYTKSSTEEKFRLIVPEAAELASSNQEILNTLVNASEKLDVGGYSEEVKAIAAPAPIRRGGAAAGSDFWTSAQDRVDERKSTWLHEYFHTRQNFTVSGIDNVSYWMSEGSATFYSLVLGLELGDINFEELRRSLVLSRDERSPILANDSTYISLTEYDKGSLVLSAIDYRIRRATGGEKSLEDVFRKVNSYDGVTTNYRLKEIAENVSGREFDSFFESYVNSSGTPLPPSDPSAYSFIKTSNLEGKIDKTAGGNGSVLISSHINDIYSTTHIVSFFGLPWAFYNSYGLVKTDSSGGFSTEVESSKGLGYGAHYVQYGDGFPDDGIPDIYSLGAANRERGEGFKLDKTEIPEASDVNLTAVDSQGDPVSGALITLKHRKKKEGSGESESAITLQGIETGDNGRLNISDSLELAGNLSVRMTGITLDAKYVTQKFRHTFRVDEPASVVGEFVRDEEKARVVGYVVKDTNPSKNESVTVSAVVGNRGGSSASLDVSVYKDGEKLETKTVNIDGKDKENKIKVIDFETSFDTQGNHSVSVSGIQHETRVDVKNETRKSIKNVIANLLTEDDKISFRELQKAINFWVTGKEVPGTGRKIDFKKLQSLISEWATS